MHVKKEKILENLKPSHMRIFLSRKKSVGVWVDELSQIWISDSDWAGGKEWGAVRVTIDLDVHMGVPEWPHKLLDLKKVVQNDPKVTKKCKKWPPTGKEMANPSKVQIEGSIMFPYPHQNIFQGR